MKIAVQCGSPNPDPYQTTRLISEAVYSAVPAATEAIFVEQPTTMQTQMEEALSSLDLTVTKVRLDFMRYGTRAWDCAVMEVVRQADMLVVISPGEVTSTADRSMASYFYFYGKPYTISSVEYQGVTLE